jgi:hypothetical protein
MLWDPTVSIVEWLLFLGLKSTETRGRKVIAEQNPMPDDSHLDFVARQANFVLATRDHAHVLVIDPGI